MKNKYNSFIIFVITLFIFTFSSSSSVFSETGFAVIANSKVQADNISFEELRKIFTGEKQFWSQGQQRITIIMPPLDSPEGKAILKEIYDKSEAQYRKYWIAKVFRAEIPVAPNVVKSSKTALKIVKAVEGSISIINATDLPNDVKVLSVNNLKAGQGGYPLH
jgi:ABC-type phosphate transport system substrate-binding protein